MKLPTTWTTKDKKVIPIKEMTDSHLLNAIAMIRRTAPRAHDEYISSLASAFSSLQGEMAQYAAEGEFDAASSELTDDWLSRQSLWKALKREAESRKLPEPP